MIRYFLTDSQFHAIAEGYIVSIIDVENYLKLHDVVTLSPESNHELSEAITVEVCFESFMPNTFGMVRHVTLRIM